MTENTLACSWSEYLVCCVDCNHPLQCCVNIVTGICTLRASVVGSCHIVKIHF